EISGGRINGGASPPFVRVKAEDSSLKNIRLWGARRIRKKSYAKVFRASVGAETSRLPVCGSAARRNRRLG
ncbi:hypothetical protein DOH73_23870, partial [Salmonella enterica subsp. enterica serovar Virchow]|nr:hypothetical protein [Salmonella enterica subsp. enterica serovar Virchow]